MVVNKENIIVRILYLASKENISKKNKTQNTNNDNNIYKHYQAELPSNPQILEF